MDRPKNEDLDALCDFLLDNPDGFATLDPRDARVAIARLLERRKPIELMVAGIATAKPVFREELLQELDERLKGTGRWLQFVKALLELEWDIDHAFDPEAVGDILDCVKAFEIVFDHRETLFDEAHPLFPYLRADEYWQRRIRWYLASSDLRRAGDELIKALRGYPSNQEHKKWAEIAVEQHGEMLRALDRSRRCLYASKEKGAKLTREVFEAMVRAGLVKPLKDGDCLAYRHACETIYETKKRGDRRPESHHVFLPVAGINLALLFVQEESLTPEGADLFTPEGAMLLKIAAFLRERRNDRRRERHEALVLEYEREHGAAHAAPPATGA